MSKFTEGKSGNPIGRPRGIKDKRTFFAEILDSYKDALLDKAMTMALDGNEQLLRLFLDRLLPAKPKDDPVNLNLNGTIGERTAQVMSCLATGGVSPMQANELLNCIEKETEIINNADVEKRLAMLEEQVKNNKDQSLL